MIEFEIVIVELLDENDIPVPATRDTLFVLPFRVNVFPAPAAGTESKTVFPLVETPALNAPIPEKTRTLLNVPEVLAVLNVFAPDA